MIDKKDITFGISLVAALALLIFFIGNSMTSNASQEMECEDGQCYQKCQSDTECLDVDTICCKSSSVGVCKEPNYCSSYSGISLGNDLDIVRIKEFNNPQERIICQGRRDIYYIILFSSLIFGLVYFYGRFKK